MAKGATLLPNYISAKSPRGLRLKMLKVNARHGVSVQYSDIQFVNGKWFAWYYVDVRSSFDVVDL